MPRGKIHRTHAMLAAILLLFAVPVRGSELTAGKPGVGGAAPRFTASDLSGNVVSLDVILASGKVVFLNFWGLRCGNCITEIGYLNPLHDRYASKGAVFLGVNVDGLPAEALGQAIPKMPNAPKYTVIPDPDFKFPDLYNMAGAPLSLIIGKDGTILFRHEDFQEGDEKEIEKALADAVAAKGKAP